MSNDGVSSDLELNTAELEEDSNSSTKFKCSLSSDSAPLIMGLNSDYCNNGGTGSGNLGLGLLQNLDESNLFHGDVYEWIRTKTVSGSIVDLDNSKIESLDLGDKIVELSELTSPRNDNADIETALQVYTLSPNLALQTQTDSINTTFLEELNGFQSDTISKEDSLSENVFLHLSPTKNECKNQNSNVDSLGLLRSDEYNPSRNDVRLPKPKSALPYIKIPKKFIRSGQILKKENYKSLEVLKAIEQPSTSTNIADKVSFEPTTAIIDVSSNTNLQLYSTDDIRSSEIVMFPVSNDNITFISDTMASADELQSCVYVNSELANGSEEKPSKAVVAISTDKLEDRTEIVIKTEIGEEQYIGKASDILKATNSLSNFCLKLESPESLSEEGVTQTELSADILVAINPEDVSARKDNSPSEEEPVTEALKTLGIVPNDQWEIKAGNRHNWSCPIEDCDHVFSKLSALKIHILTHFNIKPFKCHYEGCSWSFYTSFRLKRHLTTHLKKKEYKCDSCNSTFTTIYNLSTHLKLHDRPANMVCTVEGCNKAFQTKRKLEVHLKEHGLEHAPHVCEFESCGKRFYSLNGLQSHQRVHQHDVGDLQCEFCKKLFDKPCRLIAHIRCHTGVKPYNCNYEGCKWAFTSSSKLSRHQTKHTQDRRFFCNLCPKAFLRAEHLKDHQRTHYVSKSFACPVKECGITFSAKSSLYVHMKKHRTNEDNKDIRLNKTKITAKQLEDNVENCNNTINLLVMNPFELWPGHESGLYTIEGANDGDVETQVQFESCVSEDVSRVELEEEHDNHNITYIVSAEESGDLNVTDSSLETADDVQPYNNSSVEFGCARTYLKCQDLSLKRYHVKKKSKKKHLSTENQQTNASSSSVDLKKPESSDVQVVSDIVLTTSLLGGSQDNLMGLQMLQDEPTSSSADWYGNPSEDSSIVIPGSVGEFHQVFLLESPLAIHATEFEPSTINLKDLE